MRDAAAFYGKALDDREISPGQIRVLITMDLNPDRYERLELLAEVLEEKDRPEFIDAVASRRGVTPGAIRKMLGEFKRGGLRAILRRWL